MCVNSDRTQYLVALAKAGDQVALDRLCGIYAERIRRIVRLRIDQQLRSKLDSVDVVQDVLVLALDGLKDFTYENEGDFLRWLSRIAENKLRDHLDRFFAEKRDVRREIPFYRKGETTAGGYVEPDGLVDETTPSVVVSKKEQLDRLEKAMDQLKPEQRQVVVLSRIEGLSHAEVAERLGKSTGAVAMLLSRALVALTIAYESI